MTVIVRRIAAGESIEIVEGPDEICAPRLTEADAHCCDDSVHNRDLQAVKDVGKILQVRLYAGARVSVNKRSLKRLRAAFTQEKVRTACKDCQWGDLCTDISTNGYEGTIV